MPDPNSCPLARGIFDVVRDQLERFLPGCIPPFIDTALFADLRSQQSFGIVDDLMRILAADTEKTLAVRIALVAFCSDEFSILHLCQHTAESRVTAHGTHSFDGASFRRVHERNLSLWRWQGGFFVEYAGASLSR